MKRLSSFKLAAPSIRPAFDERLHFRRLLVVISLLSVAWVGCPYLVLSLFGAEAADGTASIGLIVWLMTIITITKPERSRLSKLASSRIYLFVAAAFVFCLSAMVLYLWFYG